MTPPPTTPPVIALRDVTYGLGRTVIGRAVTFTVAAGELVGMIGPTGSGKTTLLKVILGLLRPWQGSVTVDGVPAQARRRAVGYVPQLAAIDWDFPMTVEELVLMGWFPRMGWRAWPTAAERRRVAQLLDRLGILECLARQIRELSGGQQQRAFLARALIGAPPLVLLDEPTADVDVGAQHEILHLLGELNRGGMTIVLTTHDLNAVAAHLPRVIGFNHGVVADGPPGAIFTPEVLQRTFGAEMLVMHHDGIFMAGPATPLDLTRP